MKTSLLSQTRLFMVQCLLTMVLAFSFNNAHAQGVETTQSYVGTYMSSGQEIGLMQRLNLSSALSQGKEILSIKVAAQSNSYDSKIVLNLNGQRIEAKPVSTHSYETVFTLPRLNRNDRLSLKIRGSVYVEKVSADIKKPYVGGGAGGANQNGVVRAVIHQSTRGVHLHKVKQLIKTHNPAIRLQGQKVVKIIMKASSNAGQAKATLLINGSPVGYAQTIPRNETRLVFSLDSWSQNIIGQDIRSIQIEVRGNVQTKMVALKLAASGSGQGGYNQSVSINVNQAFYGSQRVSLSQLVSQSGRVDQDRAIEAITITAQGRGVINVAGAGRGQGGMTVQGPTTQSIRVVGHTTVRDLMLRIKATGQRVMIKQIRIKFKGGRY